MSEVKRNEGFEIPIFGFQYQSPKHYKQPEGSHYHVEPLQTESLAMKTIISLICFCVVTGYAADSGEALSEPQTLLKVITAIESSKIDELTSKKDEQGTSYHLRRANFLGTVTRDGQIYTIAHASYVRSSPPGRDTPPPRGHDFIVILDPRFRIVTHGRTGIGEYHMQGDVLKFGDTVVADFGSSEPAIRYHGWLLDSTFLPYPFSDKISEADWQSGGFRNKK